MRDSIFNGPIKDIAKALVKASDGNIKQTEALNLLAKMDGFPSYNKECREFANYEQNIKAALQLKVEELEKQRESLGKNPLGDGEQYIKNLFKVISSFFVFKDNSKILIVAQEDSAFEFFEDGFKYCVYKNLLDIDITRFNTLDYRMAYTNEEAEELKIYNSLKDTVYQEVPYINKGNQLFSFRLINKHPSKIIDWFRKYFDLKYSGYSNKYNQDNSLINNYLSNITVDIKTSYKEQLLEAKEIEEYFVDIDYILKEHNIKIRLSYRFSFDYMIASFNDYLFIEDSKFNIREYILKEINYLNSDLSRQSHMDFGYNNHFGICLVGVQFSKIDEEFNFQISTYDKKIDGDFSRYYQLSKVSASLVNPACAFDISVNELTKNLLKKQSYSKYSCIEEGIKNNETIYELHDFRCIEDLDFNVNKDITFATYKYVFETLNNELVHIMNKTSKEVLADIIEDIHKRRELVVEFINSTIKSINEKKFTSLELAINVLKEALNNYIIKTSGMYDFSYTNKDSGERSRGGFFTIENSLNLNLSYKYLLEEQYIVFKELEYEVVER